MSGTYTSIGNPSSNTAMWQMNFDEAGFASGFSNQPSGVSTAASTTAAPNFANFDAPGHTSSPANTTTTWNTELSAPSPKNSGGQSPWMRPMPSPSTQRLDQSAATQSSGLPSISTTAPKVHIRSAEECAANPPAAFGDLCSIAPPPPVNVRQKTSVGEGISRTRPGTERKSRMRRHSSMDDSSSTTDGNTDPMASLHQQTPNTRHMVLPGAMSFDLSSPSRTESDTSSPWSAVNNTADGSRITHSELSPAPRSDAASSVSLLDSSLPSSAISMRETHSNIGLSAPLIPDTTTITPPPLRHPAQMQGDGLEQQQQQEPPSDDWTISQQQREYYETQFRNLADNQEVVTGAKARGFFLKSRLPAPELSQIWRLSDVDNDGALNSIEFCVAMQLVFARRRGIDLPDALPPPLVAFHRDCSAATLAPHAVPSPSQLPLLNRTPDPSDSDSDDEANIVTAATSTGSAWQGSTLSTETDGKPSLKPKPSPAGKDRPVLPKRPTQPDIASPNRSSEPGSPHHRSADADSLSSLKPDHKKPTRPAKSATLGRGPVQPLDRSSTGWSQEAGDLIGRQAAPEPAPRVPRRAVSGHHRGGSVGDPRLMASITSGDFPPHVPTRETVSTGSDNRPSHSTVAELGSLLEGRMSETRGHPAKAEDSPKHSSLDVAVHEGSVATAAAELAQALQGPPTIRAGTTPRLGDQRKVQSDTAMSAPGPVINRRPAKKPDRPAVAPLLKSTPAEPAGSGSVEDSYAKVQKTAEKPAEESIYASIPKSQKRAGSQVKGRISKCRDKLLALSALNQELQSELYQARQARLSLQYELERLQAGQAS
ncbi:mucin-5AC-like isoform X2 [Sycon ciliatum]|uniref:mucin-5AC-like isoform X2 n=1 Tax=Sycon ciliatum TaxID=27933 RepID=UPI0020A97B7E|eukprot:scpid27611/ scgid5817/ RalBP1-associated Eps domain-containing protein 2; Partner of RalBP1; RalBP1-interacting protein 2